MDAHVGIHFFEKALVSDAWIYPCSLDDLRNELRFPPEDLDGLWAVGLTPSTRRDWSANGRYFFRPKPEIRIYSYDRSLCVKMPQGCRQSDLDTSFPVEMEFGMRVERRGARWFCCWEAEDLRLFILRHVLAHEVGHHVHAIQRMRQGYIHKPRTRECEQFAEDYALRHVRSRVSP